MRKKVAYLTTLILVVFITGFFIGRFFRPYKVKDIEITEKTFDKVIIQNRFKKESEMYIDSANNEMFNYAVKYNHLTPNLLPDKYKGCDKKMIEYNKENFFYYYSMYKINDYLSKSKSSMINAMIMENKKGS